MKLTLQVLLVLALAGCASEQITIVGRQPTPAEEIWIARCGSCHRRVRPATQTPAHVEKEMAKHERQKRVKLAPEEWQLIIAFLEGPMPDGIVSSMK